MQQKDEKTKQLALVIGNIIREYRLKNKNCSINQFAHEYDLDVGNTSRIENGLTDIKLVTLWKMAEALGVSPSFLIKEAEKQLGKGFCFFEV